MSIEIERAEAVTWIRVQMARHGLSLADLVAAGCFGVHLPAPRRAPHAVHYSNAEGETWDGQGVMPSWLQRAVNAGQSINFFRSN